MASNRSQIVKVIQNITDQDLHAFVEQVRLDYYKLDYSEMVFLTFLKNVPASIREVTELVNPGFYSRKNAAGWLDLGTFLPWLNRRLLSQQIPRATIEPSVKDAPRAFQVVPGSHELRSTNKPATRSKKRRHDSGMT